MRGANDSSKKKIIKSFIRNQRVDLLCIQETKIQPMSKGIVKSLGSGRFLDWRALDAEGSAGGVICYSKLVVLSHPKRNYLFILVLTVLGPTIGIRARLAYGNQ